ncbi:hypothetical protein M406DRAFT_331964 [Cryphonectria parasitica EP155]|uniref:Uncharacterized protein n=1 Tax=Cryphonectria parasitica (strain ATCC 38755 / EP155) TaxID=660469 RepID=A0A9P5CMU5_CRYP1|nr:uncharacterized protein M406DRAFT_331964 [Cryphonectria parasitica EP155]KAF3763446.1 hypothetical protein M406DRAFT_331964 [Cryphonectria parasitica EP155]
MPRKLLPAPSAQEADADGDMEMGYSDPTRQDARDTSIGPTNHDGDKNRVVPRPTGHSLINIVENTPQDIDQLVIRQLTEDLSAYRYDLDFCRAQLDPDMVGGITPHEVRTFQLRILDLGHQMRMLQHRIQLMQAGMNNARHVASMTGKAGTMTASAYYGAWPPGTNSQPDVYNGGGAAAARGQYGGGTPISSIQSSTAGYGGYPDGPQERRGPGRPPGSKNRPRPFGEFTPSSSLTANGSAKAAALASAGAKRMLPDEIRVATPDRDASTPGVDGRATSEIPAAKRPRHDVRVGSPLSHTTEDDNAAPTISKLYKTSSAAGKSTLKNTAEDEREDSSASAGPSIAVGSNTKKTNTFLAANSTATPSTPVEKPSAAHPRVTSPPSSSPAVAGSGPRGDTFQRLGHWMCTLCTSQKYLQQPAPKQPSEPSSWPLRDISKMVTHLTRMHTEHSNTERCMELGSALDQNRGPFKYWIRITKKERLTDEELDAIITELIGGNLPDTLRRLSSAAAAFPK